MIRFRTEMNRFFHEELVQNMKQYTNDVEIEFQFGTFNVCEKGPPTGFVKAMFYQNDAEPRSQLIALVLEEVDKTLSGNNEELYNVWNNYLTQAFPSYKCYCR